MQGDVTESIIKIEQSNWEENESIMKDYQCF